jgi:hypothetical protein
MNSEFFTRIGQNKNLYDLQQPPALDTDICHINIYMYIYIIVLYSLALLSRNTTANVRKVSNQTN